MPDLAAQPDLPYINFLKWLARHPRVYLSGIQQSRWIPDKNTRE